MCWLRVPERRRSVMKVGEGLEARPFTEAHPISPVSHVVQWVKNLPAMQATQETRVRSLGWEGLLEEGTWTEWNGSAFQYSCLENPHGQRSLAGYSPQGQRGEYSWATEHTQACTHQISHCVQSMRLLPEEVSRDVWVERQNKLEGVKGHGCD